MEIYGEKLHPPLGLKKKQTNKNKNKNFAAFGGEKRKKEKKPTNPNFHVPTKIKWCAPNASDTPLT